jgi:protein-S-isoprenylcysteine O-methyltransferase Ste14
MRTKIVMLATIPFLVEDLWEGLQPYSVTERWGIIGVILIVAGVLIRSWAAGTIHKTETLTMEGPYAIMRHPLYAGSLLIAMGFCTMLMDWENFLLVAILLVPLHIRRTLREEKKLSELYGEAWMAYKARVGAFFPKVKPMGFLAGWSGGQWIKNKEYGALVTSVVILILMQIWHMHPTFFSNAIANIK